jgi:hypothetical protein
MDAVFKALADRTRRRLLGQLFKKDGQPLSALEGRLPDRGRHSQSAEEFARI